MHAQQAVGATCRDRVQLAGAAKAPVAEHHVAAAERGVAHPFACRALGHDQAGGGIVGRVERQVHAVARAAGHRDLARVVQTQARSRGARATPAPRQQPPEQSLEQPTGRGQAHAQGAGAEVAGEASAGQGLERQAEQGVAQAGAEQLYARAQLAPAFDRPRLDGQRGQVHAEEGSELDG